MLHRVMKRYAFHPSFSASAAQMAGAMVAQTKPMGICTRNLREGSEP